MVLQKSGKPGVDRRAEARTAVRELIVIGTNEGLAAARSRVAGRPTVVTEEVVKAARNLLPDPARSITSIARLLGVSPKHSPQPHP
ncbi:hypothetical protein AB0L71_09905 [Streptomyces sp. NPDC052052]|uniref:hypothetical protein n=1 Tax=Streptomyces sp. NPDC052052 TaxID=3154756 RepID=UPI003447E6F4